MVRAAVRSDPSREAQRERGEGYRINGVVRTEHGSQKKTIEFVADFGPESHEIRQLNTSTPSVGPHSLTVD